MSKRLTRFQIDHATQRIRTLHNKMQEIFEKSLGPIPNNPELSLSKDKKMDMICKGTATLRPANQISHYSNLLDAHTYEAAYSSAEKKQIAQAKLIESKCEENEAKLYAMRVSLIDQLVLGDSEDAMVMLIAMEAKVA